FDLDGNRTPDDNRRFRQREYGFFFQDSWKVRPNFTLTYGLRWQFNGIPYEADGLFTHLFEDPSGPGPFTFVPVGPNADRRLYNNDFRNFEPRFGFSWDPFKNGKTSVRGGYGIFHDRIFGNLFGNSRGNPPFQRDVQSFPFFEFIDTLAPPAEQVPSDTASNCVFDFNTFGCSNLALIFPVLFDQNLKMPYSQNWNLGIQRELPGNVIVELNYVGTKGTRLLRLVDGNPPQPELVANLQALGIPDFLLESSLLYLFDPNVFGVFFPFFGYPAPAVNNTAFFQAALNKSIAFSTYHAVQLNVTKRFSRGFHVQGAYTWSHAIDDASDPLDAAAGNRSFPRNSFNLLQERGTSDFDQRHRLSVNYTWDLPFGKGRKWGNQGVASRLLEGFALSGIITLQSGHPYEIFGNRDSQHTGLSNRATLLGSPTFPGTTSDQTGPSLGAPGCEIDTVFGVAPFCDFVLPEYEVPGNIGRNTFTGPIYQNWDFILSKTTTITERVKFTIRGEVYNIFNRAQFLQPGNSIAIPSNFGLSTGTIGRPDATTSARQVQVAARITF
ncbi:MAG: hypothetical protein ACREB3_01035, partial [Burkholderiales bacterium]